MSHPRCIVCATDLSQPADEAIRQAATLAAQTSARLIVLHAVSAFDTGTVLLTGLPGVSLVDRDAAKARLLAAIEAQIKRATVAPPTASTIEREVLPGERPAYATIVEFADAVGADLIVVGSKGATGLRRMLLGSVAEAVVRHAACQVLVARPSPPGGRVLVATDLSDPSLVAVVAADAEARRRGGGLTAVHCLDLPAQLMAFGGGVAVPPAPPELPESAAARTADAERRLRSALAVVGVAHADAVAHPGPAAPAITALAEQLAVELVVVATHGRTGFSRLLMGSVAESIVRHAPCSVLAVRRAPAT